MIEFATWVFAIAMGCAVSSGFFFIVAPAERASVWSALGVITGMTAVALGVVLVIAGLDGIIRAVAMSMGF